PVSSVSVADPQRGPRPAAEHRGRVDRLTRLHPGETPPCPGAEVSWTLGDDRELRSERIPGRQQSGMQRYRLQITAVRLADRDRSGEVVVRGKLGHGPR